MAQKKSPKELSTAQKVGLGVGLTAAAVTAAGAFFLYGSKQASANRKKVKGWMLKAKGEVLEALEKAEHITEEEYKELIKTVSGAYSTAQNATKGEIKDFAKEMTDHWKQIEKNGAVKKVKAAVTGKAPAKKAAAKAAPKKAVAKVPAKKAAAKKTAG